MPPRRPSPARLLERILCDNSLSLEIRSNGLPEIKAKGAVAWAVVILAGVVFLWR